MVDDKSGVSDIGRSISSNKKLIIIIGLIIFGFIFITYMYNEYQTQKSLQNPTGSVDSMQQREQASSNMTKYYVIGGLILLGLILWSGWATNRGDIDYLEAGECVLKTVRKMQAMRKTYPNTLPDGDPCLTGSGDLHRMPADWNESFLWEIGFCIIDRDNVIHNYSWKVHPKKGDVRIVGSLIKHDKPYIGEEVYFEIRPVAIDKIDRWMDYYNQKDIAKRNYLGK